MAPAVLVEAGSSRFTRRHDSYLATLAAGYDQHFELGKTNEQEC